MSAKKHIYWFYIIAFLFIAVNIFFISREQFYVSLIPLALIVVMLAVFSLDKLVLFVVFLTPLSLPLSEYIPGLDFNMFLPTEPILAGILLLFILKVLQEGSFDKKILTHPVSLAIYFNLVWILITTVTSTYPVVSLKFLISRMWFLATFYFLAAQLFKNQKNIGRYIWFYTFSLIIVIGYIFYRQSKYGLFDQESANFVPQPFYNDHTASGAAFAMLFPMMIGFLFLKEYSRWQRLAALVVLGILSFAIVFSYTRATWISMLIAAGIFIIILLKIRFRTILIITLVVATLLFSFWTNILMMLEQNRQDSSSNLSEQIQSITNITTDASNMERLNRWNCALRMFKEKPVFGWGPGTYAFNYAPFQFSYEKTIISTNFGDMGNAHSEYLGPLSEMGVLGTLSILLIIGTTIYTALRVYKRSKNKTIRIIVLSSLVGLITYYVHGLLNNFLDTDKLSALFWAFTAVIVVMDLRYRESKDSIPDETEAMEQQ